jgi:hypothetical protein
LVVLSNNPFHLKEFYQNKLFRFSKILPASNSKLKDVFILSKIHHAGNRRYIFPYRLGDKKKWLRGISGIILNDPTHDEWTAQD